ncbi:hypothetical protein BGW41_004498 [Actinomortierella wolfii]|nr:hypothetical protein BGW41_004498 [Actinomortierella wolfii]
MSWNEFALELAKRQHDLETLYSDIDVPDNEKTTQYSKLFGDVLGLMNAHVLQLQRLKDRLNEEVETLFTEIQNLTLWLGQEDDSVEQLSKKLEGLSLYSKHRLLQEERDSRFELYAQKLDTIRGLHRQLHDFSIQLGSSFVDPGPYPEEGAHVTFDVIQKFTYNIEECQKEKERRIEKIKAYIVAIKHLWGELGWTPQDSFDRNVIEKGDEGEGYSLLEETITRLELKQIMLEDERKKREVHVQELRNEIKILWEKLRIEDDEQEQFFEGHLGLTLPIINAHKKELERLHDLKRLKLEEFVVEERNKIYDLWDRLYYSQEQREAFEPMYTDELTDELLEQHEQEVARLSAEANELQPILTTVERYQRMIEEVRQFEASTRDSSRLLKPEPGLLLKEEKTRRRLKREQPLLEQELQQLLLQYQEEKGKPFLVYGEEYIVTMKTHMAEAREGRESERKRLELRRELRRAGDLRYGSQNPKNPKATHHSFVRSISPPQDFAAAGAPQTPTHSRTYNAFGGSSPYPTTPSRSRGIMMSPRHAVSGSTTVIPPQSPASKVTQYLLQTPSGQMHKHLGGGNGANKTSRSESPAVHRTMAMPTASTPTSARSLSVAALESGAAGMSWTPTRSQSIISVASMDLNDAAEHQPSTPTRVRTPRSGAMLMTTSSRIGAVEDLTVSTGGGGAKAQARLQSIAENGKKAMKRRAAELSSSPSGSRSPSPSRTHQHQHHPQHHGVNPFFTSESAQRHGERMARTREEDSDDVTMDETRMANDNSSSQSSNCSSSVGGAYKSQPHQHYRRQQRLRGGRSKSQPIEVDEEDEDDGWETEEDEMIIVEQDKVKRRKQDVATSAIVGSSSKQTSGGRTTSSSSSSSAGSQQDAMIIQD